MKCKNVLLLPDEKCVGYGHETSVKAQIFSVKNFLGLKRLEAKQAHLFKTHQQTIQGVTGGTDQTSGECSLGQTIPI